MVYYMVSLFLEQFIFLYPLFSRKLQNHFSFMFFVKQNVEDFFAVEITSSDTTCTTYNYFSISKSSLVYEYNSLIWYINVTFSFIKIYHGKQHCHNYWWNEAINTAMLSLNTRSESHIRKGEWGQRCVGTCIHECVHACVHACVRVFSCFHFLQNEMYCIFCPDSGNVSGFFFVW